MKNMKYYNRIFLNHLYSADSTVFVEFSKVFLYNNCLKHLKELTSKGFKCRGGGKMAHELTFVSLMHVFTSLGRLPRRRFSPMIEGTRLKTFKFSNWILFCFSMWKNKNKNNFQYCIFLQQFIFHFAKVFFQEGM